MAIDWQQSAVNLVPSVVAAVLSARLTTKWALARFRAEKWWEKKVAAYTEIVRALFLVKRYVDDWTESHDTRTERTGEYKQRLLDDWHQSARAVEEATAIGSFIISPAAAEVLSTLQRERSRGDPDDAYDMASHESAALAKAIPAFVAAAQADLHLGGSALLRS